MYSFNQTLVKIFGYVLGIDYKNNGVGLTSKLITTPLPLTSQDL